ncbi:PhnD/SsuA/transferrin family substrate-binding protein [Rhodospirillaceae bacterium KN72]|uniref:PhnD/SsuA/transferrin family substrate-binding protein n=1 Tax=Pacificispira spongiicola TaxID=2729598 RepID=A0A7Y0DWG7_9PROT|nr:PhnD/SsuA/transferrin family substrate-binding protein [Pacificispira spongiicola]NMM42881.1 PhnD/SsuA/transferrin family substrate-binding protein [Pacificispira spongiicola]
MSDWTASLPPVALRSNGLPGNRHMPDRIASLPQYDLPELRQATDAWWTGIARHMRVVGLDDVPQVLTRAEDAEALWRDPHILLTQTCGYPLMTELSDCLRPVATPIYRCDGCRGATYSSVLIVRTDGPLHRLEDARGKVAAANNRNSHSGMNALRHCVAPLATDGRFFGRVLWTGGHAASAQAVAEGKADIAAVDAVTWALLSRERSALTQRLRVIGNTDYAPSLPYATRIDAPEAVRALLFQALAAAAADPSLASVRHALLIGGFTPADFSTYQTVLDWKADAAAAGYPDLR